MSDQAPSSNEHPTIHMFRPPWADPHFILATSWARFTGLTTGSVSPLQIMAGDTRRVGFLVSISSLAMGTSAFYPSNGRSTTPIINLAAGGTIKLTLFNDGPMVCDQWFMNVSPNVNIGVYEWLIGPMEV